MKHGAEDETRTRTDYSTRPSNVRGYQLRHLGLEIEAKVSASLNFQFKNYLFDGSVCAGLGSSTLFETFALTGEEFVAVLAFVNSFVLVMIIVFAALFVFGEATLAFVFASITLAELVFVSVVEDGESLTVSNTEILPVNAGIAKSKADSINVAAAIIVILDKIVCAPRG